MNWSSLDQALASKILISDYKRIGGLGYGCIVPYRADRLLERFGQVRGVSVLSISSDTFERASKKSFLLSLRESLSSVAPGIRIDDDDWPFEAISERIGAPFFLKSEDTVSGNGCFYVESASDMRDVIARYPDCIKTAWRFVDGTSLNFHFSVGSASQVILLPPSCQIIQMAGRFGRMEFVGSNFAAPWALDPALLERASAAVLDVAVLLARKGYRGVAGADVIATAEDARVVDLNPRFQGSSALLSIGMAKRIGITLGRLQALSFSAEGYQSIDLAELGQIWGGDFGTQVIVKNGRRPCRVRKHLQPGVYQIGAALRFTRSLSASLELARDEVAVLDTPEIGIAIDGGASLGRVWLPRDSMLLSDKDIVVLVSSLVCDALQVGD